MIATKANLYQTPTRQPNTDSMHLCLDHLTESVVRPSSRERREKGESGREGERESVWRDERVFWSDHDNYGKRKRTRIFQNMHSQRNVNTRNPETQQRVREVVTWQIQQWWAHFLCRRIITKDWLSEKRRDKRGSSLFFQKENKISWSHSHAPVTFEASNLGKLILYALQLRNSLFVSLHTSQNSNCYSRWAGYK